MVEWMNDLKDGRRLYSIHIHSIVQALARKYVKSGCRVVIDNGMSLFVNSGVVRYNGQDYNISSQNIVIDSNETSVPRADIIVWDYNGGLPTIKVVKGTETFTVDGNTYAIAPVLTDEQIPLALVVVNPDDSSISASNLYDLRVTGQDLQDHTHDVGDIVFNGSVIPTQGGVWSIGGQNYKWRDVYSISLHAQWMDLKNGGDPTVNLHVAAFGRSDSPASGSPNYQIYIGAQGGDKENEMVFTATDGTIWRDLLGLDFDNNEVNVYASTLNVAGSILEGGASLETKYALAGHTHVWTDIDKTGSKLSDIDDVPDYTGNASKFLRVNATEDGVEWVSVALSDEYVKADATDTAAGYLSDKVDGATIEVDTVNHVLKVKDGVFALIDLSNVADSTILTKIKNVDGSGSGLDADLLDGHDSSQFMLVSTYDSDADGVVENADYASSAGDADTVDGYHASDFALVGHTHALGDLSDVTLTSAASMQILKYNGSVWVNDYVDWSEVTNKPSTYPPSSHTHSVSDITFDGNIVPNADNVYDIGSSSNKWKDGYFAGTVSAGTVSGTTIKEDSMLISEKYLETNWKIITDSNTGDVVVIKKGMGEVYRGTADGAFNYVTTNCVDGDVIDVYGDYTITQSIEFSDKSYIKFRVYGTITNNVSGDYAVKFIGSGFGTNKFNDIMVTKIVGNGSNYGILIQDGFNNKIHDCHIENVAKGITISAAVEWGESNVIEHIDFGGISEYNIGFEVGGNLTDTSFINTTVRHVAMNVQKYGIYIGPGAHVNHSWFENVHGWATADNAVFVMCDGGKIWKDIFVNPYFEDVNSNYSGEIMFYAPACGSYVVLEPHPINIDAVYGDDGTNDNKPVISFNDHYIEFANKAPSVYGGITNVYDDFFVGWRLTGGDQKRVVNIFDKDRIHDVLWIWQNTTDWQSIFILKKDGSTEQAGYIKSNGIIGSSVGSAILKFMNDVNDNKLYLELFSSDESGTGDALWITGRLNQENIPSVNIKTDRLWVNGDLSIVGGIKVNNMPDWTGQI